MPKKGSNYAPLWRKQKGSGVDLERAVLNVDSEAKDKALGVVNELNQGDVARVLGGRISAQYLVGRVPQRRKAERRAYPYGAFQLVHPADALSSCP